MNKRALNNTDLSAIKQYATGGAMVGGGAALVTSLMNYLNTLKQDAQESTTLDDDTLYVDVPAKKKQPLVKTASADAVVSPIGSGLAMAGGVLSSAGAYALVKEIYNNIRKDQEQSKLDDAQNLHLQALESEADTMGLKERKKPLFKPGLSSAGYSLDKMAADMSGAEKLVGLPVAALLLMSVASAAVSNAALKKTFKPIQPKPSKLAPRRVVLRTTPGSEDIDPTIPEESTEPTEDMLLDKEAGHLENSMAAAGERGRIFGDGMKQVGRSFGEFFSNPKKTMGELRPDGTNNSVTDFATGFLPNPNADTTLNNTVKNVAGAFDYVKNDAVQAGTNLISGTSNLLQASGQAAAGLAPGSDSDYNFNQAKQLGAEGAVDAAKGAGGVALYTLPTLRSARLAAPAAGATLALGQKAVRSGVQKTLNPQTTPANAPPQSITNNAAHPTTALPRVYAPTQAPDQRYAHISSSVKEASEDWSDACEFLLDLTSQWDKEASHSDINNMLGALASGRHHELISNVCTYGSHTALDMLKGAGEELLNKSASSRSYAVGLLARCPALAPTAITLAAAEFIERAPMIQKVAMFFDDNLEDSLIKLAAHMRRIQRYDMFEESVILKQASMVPDEEDPNTSITELLHKLLAQDQDPLGDDDKSSGNVDNSTTSEFSSSRASDQSGEPNSEAPLRGGADLIDGILGHSDKAQTMLA